MCCKRWPTAPPKRSQSVAPFAQYASNDMVVSTSLRSLSINCRAVSALTLLVLAISVATAYGGPPAPHELIDRNNLDIYSAYMPAALKFAIAHGLRARVTATNRIDWPAGFQLATEKYSGQASLDEQEHIQNYVAGMPFPLIHNGDPQAAVKIAYNWRWGPFVPDDVSLSPRPRLMAWKTDSVSATLIPDDDERDFRGEAPCDEWVILRYSHRTKVDPRPNIGPNTNLEWKARGSHCGGPRDFSVTWSEDLNPWSITNGVNLPVKDLPWLIKWLQFPDLPSEKCSYSCSMVWWDYIAPVVELYAWRVVAERPILASLSASGEPSGIIRVGNQAHFDEQTFEIRNAYVLEGVPVKKHISALFGLFSMDLLSATVFIDSETYLLLGAEFHRLDQVDASIPLWSRHSVDGKSVQMELSNELFVPGDKAEFFLSLNLWPGVQKVNSDNIDPSALE